MFYKASSFNQDIGNWNTSNATAFNYMFAEASEFNQNLENWNFENITDMDSMFLDSGLSTENYDKLLIAWADQNENSGVPVTVSSYFCNGQDARDYLINQKNWQINDNGYDCSNLSLEESILDLSLYPNPTSDYIYINNNIELEAVVFDLLGKQVMIEYITDKFDISCLEKGTYILNLSDGINTSSHKIIKD